MSEPSKATPAGDDSRDKSTEKPANSPAANDTGSEISDNGTPATDTSQTADTTIPLEPVPETPQPAPANDADNDANVVKEDSTVDHFDEPKKRNKFSVGGLLVAAFKKAAVGYVNTVAAIGRKSKIAAVGAALVIPAIPAYLTMGAAGHFAEATLGNVARSSGAQNGQIEKFSSQGLLVNTYEGELATSNFSVRGQGHANNNTFEFSVDDDAVDENGVAISELIQQYQEAGVRVQLEYKQRLFTMALPFPGLTERKTHYEVVGVQPLKNQDESTAPKIPNP